MPGRNLEWDGCFNVRDLGGLPITGGGETRRSALVRADGLDMLTADGWAALSRHGVRTVIDLRNDDERGTDASPRPSSVTTVHIPLDGDQHSDFWDDWMHGPQFATPLYYQPHVERFPDRSAAVVATIATAAPGGVVFHCAGGRDRTGQIAMLALALVGVAPEDIARDYCLSAERLRALYAARGEPDQEPSLSAFLAERNTTAGDLIVDTLRSIDVETCLRKGGLTDQHLAALRARLSL